MCVNKEGGYVINEYKVIRLYKIKLKQKSCPIQVAQKVQVAL